MKWRALRDDFRTLALWESGAISTSSFNRLSVVVQSTWISKCGVLKLAQPILTTKAIDPGKLALVVGDKNVTERKRLGSNE